MTSKHDKEDKDEDIICPICFLPEKLVFSPCSHRACLPCFERILLATSSNQRPYDDDDDDNNDRIISACPSRGRCPICRHCVNMFDLKFCSNNDFVYSQHINLEDTPLNELQFSDRNSTDRNSTTILSFKDGKAEVLIRNKANNEILRRQLFECGFHYHDKCKIFAGVVDWTKSVSGHYEHADKWEVIIQFSFNFQYVFRGAIIKNHLPHKKVERLGQNDTRFYVHRSNHDSQHFQPGSLTFNSNSPWGNTFIQFHKVGYASYYFVSGSGENEDGAYISYEHEDCSLWPSLDDGSPVPERVPFIHISYDAEMRTFRGTIPWLEAYGTTWNGDSEWKYEIIFDSEFTCIIGGHVSMGQSQRTYYGSTLIYYNLAIVEIIKEKVDAEHNEEDQSLQSRFRAVIEREQGRLANEGASDQTLVLVSQGLTGVIDPSLSLIDYNTRQG